MNLSPKQLLLGAAALIILSFGVAMAIFQATDDDRVVADLTEAQRSAACIVWNERAEIVATAETRDLFTQGADAAVFLKNDVSEPLRVSIETYLKGLPEPEKVVYQSKEDAYAIFVQIFEGETEILQNTTPESLPASFRITLRAGASYESFRAAVEDRNGVELVRDDRDFTPTSTNVAPRLKTIQGQGFYVDGSGKRVPEPPGCTS